MADLRIENVKLTDDFRAAAAAAGAPLPWAVGEDGELVDADGKPVLVVDVYCERTAANMQRVLGLLLIAVHTCGGYRAALAEG